MVPSAVAGKAPLVTTTVVLPLVGPSLSWLSRVAEFHGRTGVASLPNRPAVIDRETVTMCPGAVVATVAPLHQDWSNALLKELNPIAVTGLSLQRGEAGADQEGEYQCFHPVRDISGRRWERVSIEGFI